MDATPRVHPSGGLADAGADPRRAAGIFLPGEECVYRGRSWRPAPVDPAAPVDPTRAPRPPRPSRTASTPRRPAPPIPPEVLDMAWPLPLRTGRHAGLRLPQGPARPTPATPPAPRCLRRDRRTRAVETLLALQELDTAIDQLAHQRAHLPERAAAAIGRAAASAATAALAELTGRREAIATSQTALERSLRELRCPLRRPGGQAAPDHGGAGSRGADVGAAGRAPPAGAGSKTRSWACWRRTRPSTARRPSSGPSSTEPSRSWPSPVTR